jgi:hypothetical protein
VIHDEDRMEDYLCTVYGLGRVESEDEEEEEERD